MTFSHQDRQIRRQSMAKQVASGSSLSETARKFGVTEQTVRSACLQHRQPSRTERMRHMASGSYAVLSDLVNSRMSLTTIARRRRSTRQRVFSVMQQARKAGIKIRKRA